MTLSAKPNTLSLTLAELESLPECGQPAQGYFRGQSVANGRPMVGKWVDDPLDGWKRVWFHVEIQPRAFHNCKECGAEFPGPNGGFEFVNHCCGIAA